MGNWQNTFGGANVSPAQASYAQIDLTANTALVWPRESSGQPTVASVMSVTPAAVGLSLAMPDATRGATGVAILILYNPGSASFTLTDTFGAQIGVIGAGEAWTITLQDNGTPAGSWLATQLGAGTSNAQAGQLAGAGLQAIMAALQLFIPTVYLNTNTLLDTTYRAKGVVWDSGDAGTLQLDAIATLTAGWFVWVTNSGTDDLTISTSGGDTINAVATITLPPGGSGAPYSCLIVAASDGFNTFAGTPPIIPIDGGGTGATTAEQALINLGGSAIGIDIFEAPNAAAILALLGLGASAFTEYSVASNQNITPSSINSAFVCTAALTITLPPATSNPDITTQFLFAVYAQGGAVTLNPEPGDKINGGAASAPFVIPQGASLLMLTDADGNWWPLFLSTPNGIQWAIAAGTGDAMTASYSPANTVLTDGLLIAVRAAGSNTVTDPTINVDGLGLRSITKDGGQPLVANDIPGATAEILLRYSSAHTSWELYNPTINLDLIGATQGDILYRDADDWKVLAPGTAGQILASGGAAANPAWETQGGRLLRIDSYTTHGASTWELPVGCTSIIAVVVGAGGGGASAQATSGNHGNGGGGGGAGGYTMGNTASPAASYTITVGQGGAGGASGGLNVGSAGTASSIGSLMASGGGAGGSPGTDALNSANAPGGAGGTVTTPGSILAVPGQAGGYGCGGNAAVSIGGHGGIGPYGGGAYQAASSGVVAAVAGGAGAGPGCGGGGAAALDIGTSLTAAGGAGADGLVIIYSYG